MKLYWILLPILGLLPCASPSPDTQDKKEEALVRAVFSNFNKLHFHPREINDVFSEQAFEACLSALDYDKKFLTEENIASLSPYRKTIDDELASGNLNFFNETIRLLDEGIEKAKQYMQDGLNNLDIKANEAFESNAAKRPYAKDDKALRDLWRKIVKKEVLQNLLALEKLQNATSPKTSFKILTQEAVAQTRQAFEGQFANLSKQDRNERLSIFINAVLSLYGPHNEYLTPVAQADLNIELTKSLQGIGVSVIQKYGYIQVLETMPGGPAARSGEIEEDDRILKVSDAAGNMTDIKGYSVNEAVQLFRGEKGTTVQLVIQKPNGEVKIISLVRDVVIIEDGLLKSALLEHEETKEKIGYLQLPRFYFSRGEGGRRCSDDMQTEIEKLKKSGIKGLIIDLRNNYGGSMAQTLKMMGFFIESGPLVQRQSKDKTIQIFKDEDTSVVYDGELVVLVNNRSASASELFSATLQDYDRAVIVGSKSTFGKGTIQNIVDLDNRDEIPDTTLFPLGSLKMTVGQFIRISGVSTQIVGVEPDIVIPDNFLFVESGEKVAPYAQPTLKIEPLHFSQSVNTNPNLHKVKMRSSQRMEKDKQFIQAVENARRWKETQENSLLNLNYKEFKAIQNAREISTEHSVQHAEKKLINSKALPENEAFIEADKERRARNSVWLKNISEDHSIKECVEIIRDLSSE